MPTSTPHFVQVLLDASDTGLTVERRLGAYALGILAALRNGQISVAQASDDFFNMDTLRLLRDRKLDSRIVELVEWGMELEDVTEMVPDAVAESLDAMTRLAERIIARAAA